VKLLIIIVILLVCGSCAQEKSLPIIQSEQLVSLWQTPAKFSTPESICWDESRGVCYVSNINGQPGDVDGNGFISRINLDGEILDLRWITGLNAPKGMGIAGNRLYVSDINQVMVIDIDSAKVIRHYGVNEAQFLNDITVDEKGFVYISDMLANSIYRIDEHTISLWLKDPKLKYVNGLFYQSGQLKVGTSGAILGVDIKDQSIHKLVTGFGSIDGLEGDGGDGFFASEWKGYVYRAMPGEAPVQLLDVTGAQLNSADIEYIPKKSMLLVPTFKGHSILAYRILDLQSK